MFLFSFCILYRFVIQFDTHFVAASSSAPLNSMSPAYFAVAQHTLLGDGGCLPKTPLGKMIAMMHTLVAWSITLWFFIL
jgi:hypothetical protein